MDRDETKPDSPDEGETPQAPDLTALRPTILDAIGAARALIRTLKPLPDHLPDNTAATRRLHAVLDRLTVECDRVIGIRCYSSQEGAPNAE